MKLKDKYKNQIEVYQDKTGAIQLLFGYNNIRLELWQVEELIGSNVFDIEDFNVKDFKRYYKITKEKWLLFTNKC